MRGSTPSAYHCATILLDAVVLAAKRRKSLKNRIDVVHQRLTSSALIEERAYATVVKCGTDAEPGKVRAHPAQSVSGSPKE